MLWVAALRLVLRFRPQENENQEDKHMEYKRVPFSSVEHTEIARNRYLEFQRSKDAPDEAQIEAEWLKQHRRLRAVLDKLTPRQQQVYILRIGYEMKEDAIAERLHISQSTVSRHLKFANKKIQKVLRTFTDK
ncbi:sigma-70 family RNA polymerase sigma factor [Ruminococcaceae bacterium OttesenSCG-928-L11]|nr:sigma-70 family RNA polymerase sigma factor [Ruminococcaceae bacterium OttesenSCG-928-L11]